MLEIAVCRLQGKHALTSYTRIRKHFEGVMTWESETDYPHTISFRLTNEAWLGIQKDIQNKHLIPHEWCRMAALERLNSNGGLSKSERFLFHHLVRAQYLVTQGFQLLADHKLTSEEWKQLRLNSKQRVSELVESALASRAQYGRERPR